MPTIFTAGALVSSFIITWFSLRYWIPRAKRAKLTGKDVHKKDKREVAESGGIAVAAGFLIAVLIYVATIVFLHNATEHLTYLYATTLAVLIATSIGFVDDVLGWKIGLRARYKIALTFFIALPIIVINAGHANMNLPIIGTIAFGVLYPLVVIPIGIMGAANGFNMIAGYNGLEAIQGIIILSTLAIITYALGFGYVALLAACMVMALLAFLIFNKYPAKIFPGDTLTYQVGALIAIVAILADIEKYALILFIPYFLELVFKARGKFEKESFAKVQEDGSLEQPHDKWYGLEHIAIALQKKIRKKATEGGVVFIIATLQTIVAAFCLWIFYLAYVGII